MYFCTTDLLDSLLQTNSLLQAIDKTSLNQQSINHCYDYTYYIDIRNRAVRFLLVRREVRLHFGLTGLALLLDRSRSDAQHYMHHILLSHRGTIDDDMLYCKRQGLRRLLFGFNSIGFAYRKKMKEGGSPVSE